MTIKTVKVAGNIYVLYGQGGNIGVSAGKDGLLMIDDQFERISDKIKAALKELGSDTPRFIFNTRIFTAITRAEIRFSAEPERLSRKIMFANVC